MANRMKRLVRRQDGTTLITKKGTRAGNRHPGRYTPPIPKEVKRSPRWYPWMLLVLVIFGIAVIILNYVQALPSSPTDWYTLVGLLLILTSAIAATRYH